MKVLIIGASGQIGQRVVGKLLADGHDVTAMVRDPAKGAELNAQGAALYRADLEGDIDSAFAAVDAVVFTAGSGSTTGKDKTLMVDLWGAVKSIEAAERHQVGRFIMVSALKAKNPEAAAEGLRPYLVAKAAADKILAASSLNYTILRPGRLHDEPTDGFVSAPDLDNFNGFTSRENVAECIRQLLWEPCSEAVLDILDQ